MGRAVLIVGTLALALAACEDGGDEAPTRVRGADGEIDVCATLTTDEIASAVGNAVNDGSGEVGPQLCDWTAPPADTSVSASILVGPSVELCVEALEVDPANDRSQGFDDPAFWSYLDVLGGIGNVVVCAETGQLTLTLMAGTDAEPGERELRAAGEGLARRAVARL